MKTSSKIYVAGHNGLVGSALCRNLRSKGYHNLVTRDISQLDLQDYHATDAFFAREKPEYVFLAAAKVGGIVANNTYRADFIYNNLQIQNSVIHNSYRHGVEKLLFLGSSCIYPKACAQPIDESALLTGPLEYTNEPYALAKIAGLKMCEAFNLQYGTNFVSVMPTNLYGPYDNFDLETSHVLPALVRKMHLARLLYENRMDDLKVDLQTDTVHSVLEKHGIVGDRVTLWGTGTPMREFMYSEDMADACVYVMENVDFRDVCPHGDEVTNTHINIGTGKDASIAELVNLVKGIVGYRGTVAFDASKPDGTMRKLLNVDTLTNLGWRYKTELQEGIRLMYEWYLNH